MSKTVEEIEKRVRYERKFLLRGIDIFSLRKMIALSNGAFTERYYSRTVNNIYFDTPGFEYYSSSVRGYPVRKKIRIRWYGSMSGSITDAVLEIKSRDGVTNHKSSYPVGSLILTPGCDISRQIAGAIQAADIPEPLISELKALRPVILNSYRRTYYESSGYKVRLTLDHDLQFYGINGHMDFFLRKTAEPDMVVIELKYSPEADGIVDRLTGMFPFRLTRCSKYVLGVNRAFLFSDYS